MKKFSVLDSVLNGCKAIAVAECSAVTEETSAYLWKEIQKTDSGYVFLTHIWNTIPRHIQLDIFNNLAKPIIVQHFSSSTGQPVKLVAYINEELDFVFGYQLKIQSTYTDVVAIDIEDKSTALIEYFKAQKSLM